MKWGRKETFNVNIRRILFTVCLAAGLASKGQSILFTEEEIQEQMRQLQSGEGTFLIINGDDFGMSHSTNLGMIECFEKGILTSSTIMMPCPAIDEAIQYKKDNPQVDVGLHLTLTSEWKHHRWGPVADPDLVHSLVEPDTGMLWDDTLPVLQHARLPEARIETLAQIALAKEMGLDFNHLDCHMGWYHYSFHLYRMVRQIALDERLPIREALITRLWNLRHNGIWCTDHLDYSLNEARNEEFEAVLIKFIQNLRPGLTELVWHPALCNDELRSITGTAESRDMQRAVLLDEDVKAAITQEGVILVGYEPLRRLTRGPGPSR